MLKIYLGNMEKAIYHPPTYFDNQYEDEWITKELSIRMIGNNFCERTIRFCKDIDANGI